LLEIKKVAEWATKNRHMLMNYKATRPMKAL